MMSDWGSIQTKIAKRENVDKTKEMVEGSWNMVSTCSKDPIVYAFNLRCGRRSLAGMALEEARRTEHAPRVATSGDFAPSPRRRARAYVLNLLSERSVLFVLYLNGNTISTYYEAYSSGSMTNFQYTLSSLPSSFYQSSMAAAGEL